MSKKIYTVKLVGAKQFTARTKGGNLSWKHRQERTFLEGDSRLAYYQGQKRHFLCAEKKEADPIVPPSARPKRKKAPAPEPEKMLADLEKVEPAADLGSEDAPPLAEPEPEDLEPKPNIPSDSELEKWKKQDLLDLAEEWAVDADDKMTKAEIRAEIDKIR